MCVFVYRFVHVSASALRDQKRALDLLELELSSCETANLSGGDKTWAIYKSIAHSFFLFYFFFRGEDQTRGLALAGQALYP